MHSCICLSFLYTHLYSSKIIDLILGNNYYYWCTYCGHVISGRCIGWLTGFHGSPVSWKGVDSEKWNGGMESLRE